MHRSYIKAGKEVKKMNRNRLIIVATIVAVFLAFSATSAWAQTYGDSCCPDGSKAYVNPIQVYVYSKDTNKQIKGAAVTISGPGKYKVTDYTGRKGTTTIFTGANLPGTYDIGVTMEGYETASSSVTFTVSEYACQPQIISIGLEKPKPCERSLQVCVYDEYTNSPIQGASVTLSGPSSYSASGSTSASGCTNVFTGNFASGTYTAFASASSYYSGSNSVTFVENQCGDLVVKIYLRCERSLQVCVYDQTTGKPIKGASVSMSGPSSYSAGGSTSASGCTNVFTGNLASGTYTALASASGYDPGSATASFGVSDCGLMKISINLKLKCERSLKVCAFDEETGNPIEGAQISLSGPPPYLPGGITKEDGCSNVFTGNFASGTYTAFASAVGYEPGSATGSFGQDDCGLLEIRINLKRQCERSLQIYVYNVTNNLPIPGALVSVNGPVTYNTPTDNSGMVLMDSNLPNGVYNIRVSANNFKPGTGSITLDSDSCGLYEVGISLDEYSQDPCECKNTFQIYVYDETSNAPIRGTYVRITGPSGYSVDDYTGRKGQTGIITGANLSGTYTVSATINGYEPQEMSIFIDKTNCGDQTVKIWLKRV